MINEITITAKFVTGTTVEDTAQAKKEITRIFLKALETADIFPPNDKSGLFSVELLSVEGEKI